MEIENGKTNYISQFYKEKNEVIGMLKKNEFRLCGRMEWLAHSLNSETQFAALGSQKVLLSNPGYTVLRDHSISTIEYNY